MPASGCYRAPQLKVKGFPPPQRRREKRDPIAVNSFLENHSNAGKNRAQLLNVVTGLERPR